MEKEPFEQLSDFIEFDQIFYATCVGVAADQALAHFVQVGRFDGRPVRAFSHLSLAGAVRFDPDIYLDLNPDVREAGVDAWEHFLGFGLKEFRVIARTEVADDAFWSDLGVREPRLLTFRQQLEKLDGLDERTLAVAVRRGFHERGQVLYRSRLARLLAKACLALGWPASAAAFLSKYREGLAFSVPDGITPHERTHVCEAMTLRSYCESRNLRCVSAQDPSGSSTEPAGSIVTCLPDATICSDGCIKTSDHVCLTDTAWSGPGLGAQPAMMGPRHRALTVSRDARRISGRSVSLLRNGTSGEFACLVDAFPRLLAAAKAGLLGASARPEPVSAPLSRLERAKALLGRAGRQRSGPPSAPSGEADTIICVIAADHAAMARALLPKVKPLIGAELVLEATAHADLCADALIVSSASGGPLDGSSRPALTDRLRDLKELVAGPPLPSTGPGVLLRSDSAPVSAIANGAELDGCVRRLGLERVAPDWRRPGELMAAVSCAPVLLVGSASDATALIFARAGTPVLLLGVRTREFEAIRALALAAGTPLHVVGGLLASEEIEPETSTALIDKDAVESALTNLFGDDVFTALLQRRFADVAAVAKSVPRTEAFDVLEREAGRLYQTTAVVGRSCFSAELDELCFELGATQRRGRLGGGHARSRVRAYYATQLYRIGGHTRLIEDLIDCRPDDEHHVICSALPDIEAGCEQELVFRPAVPVTMHLVPVELNARLAATIDILREHRPMTLFHLAHPNDPIGPAILHPDAAEQLIMVHHNDHSFAFGPSRPGLTHLTVHARSRREMDELLGVPTAYVPMTSRSEGLAIVRNAEPLLTATSGFQEKFGTRNEQRYVDLLKARLSAREGRHIHIGPLAPAFHAALDRELESHGLAGRLLHVAFARCLPETLRSLRPHLYLNSFPVGGGHALVDAMAVGLPIAAGRYDARLDSSEVPYPGHLSWAHLGELQEALRSFSEAERMRHQSLAIQHFRSVHDPELFNRGIDKLLSVRPVEDEAVR